jgi:hypothetical protein
MAFLKKEGRHSVFGIFRDQSALDRTINILKSQNFRNSDISVLMQSTQEILHLKNIRRLQKVLRQGPQLVQWPAESLDG